jgi:Tol biopolymer transport system component
MQEWVGRTIGSYRIEASLGSGGMGRVYRGVHVHLNRAVAIKVLHEHLALDETFQARFLREAQAVAALSHPNIVDVLDFSHEQGVYYLVMELVPDGSLKTLLRRSPEQGPVPLAVGLDLVRQAADALDYAHRQGMIHRDIKPDNLLLRRDNTTGALTVKITDFGLARMTSGSTITITGQVMGTPAYMSPEQCQGLPLDGRSDLYSLGVVLFEVVTGAVPFSSRSVSDAVYKHVYVPPPDPRTLRPDLPQPLADVILRCLAKDPAQRFATGRELAQALTALVQPQPQPVLAPPTHIASPDATTRAAPQQAAALPPRQVTVPPPASGPPPARVQPAPAGGRPSWFVPLVAVALALLLVGAGAAFLFGGGDEPPAPTSTPEQPALVATETPALDALASPTDDGAPTATAEPAPEPTATPPEEESTATPAAEPATPTMPVIVEPTATLETVAPTATPEPTPVQRMAFAAGRNVTDPAGILDIYLMEADGSNQRVLISEPDDDWLPSVSPDGSRIVWVSRRHGNHQIYLANIDGSDVRRLTTSTVDDLYPTWSSDNRSILFVRSDGDDELFLVDAIDGTVRQLTTNDRYDGYATWAPDGEHIVWSSGAGGINQLYVMNALVEGDSPRQLTTSQAFNYQPAWSPDGTRIAYVSNESGRNALYVIPAAGGTPVQLTGGATVDDWPVWSPDGTQLAFRRSDGPAATSATLVVINADGSDARVLATNASSDDPDIRWSPDGTLLAYLSEQDGNFDIWLVRLADPAIVQLTNHPGNDKGISWFLATPE